MIEIPKELLEAMIAHAQRETPDEVCGWLAGRGHRISKICPMPNIAENPQAGFEMDPEIQLATMRETREMGLELTGTYHSHPRSPPTPSAKDRILAAYPEAIHLIVSLESPEPQLRCYRLEKRTSVPVALILDEPPDMKFPPLHREENSV